MKSRVSAVFEARERYEPSFHVIPDHPNSGVRPPLPSTPSTPLGDQSLGGHPSRCPSGVEDHPSRCPSGVEDHRAPPHPVSERSRGPPENHPNPGVRAPLPSTPSTPLGDQSLEDHPFRCPYISSRCPSGVEDHRAPLHPVSEHPSPRLRSGTNRSGNSPFRRPSRAEDHREYVSLSEYSRFFIQFL